MGTYDVERTTYNLSFSHFDDTVVMAERQVVEYWVKGTKWTIKNR